MTFRKSAGWLLTFILCCGLAQTAGAADGPVGQIRLKDNQVLRGRFTEQHTVPGLAQPMNTTGHFVASPGYGLIWAIDKPMATTSIITRNTSVQDIGGLAIKLPIKNLQHLYDIVSGALLGDWSALEDDFTLTPSGTAQHWQMLLTAKPAPDAAKPKTPYQTITVSGGAFIENIVMTSIKGSVETISFDNVNAAKLPLQPQEVAFFQEAGH